jgi:LuxR family maltose regulon positive regulatory protein
VADAKFAQPSVERSGFVVRTRLLDLLDEPVPDAVVLAPPGYGKTTLVAQWAGNDGRPVAWVTLDETDNDPVALLGSLVAALGEIRAVEPAIRRSLLGRRRADCALAIGQLGPNFAAPGPIVLVIDDVQMIEDPLCHQALTQLMGRLPSGSRVVLSGRGWPSGSLGRIRSDGKLVELGREQLAMSDPEASALVHGVGAEWDAPTVETLNAQAEGWAAGLYLAALAEKGRHPRSHHAFETDGGDRFITDYLWSELLARATPEDVRFLEETSVLERLSGDLCDAITGETGAAARLAEFEEANLMVVRLDRTATWYRYHSVFRGALERRLHDRDPARARALRQAASDWSLKHGLFEEAGLYAMAASDEPRMAALIARSGQQLYATNRTTTIEIWIDWLEHNGTPERHPAAATLAALYRALTGNAGEAERWADAAYRATVDEQPPDGSPSVDAWRGLLRAVLCRDGPDAMLRDANEAVLTLGSMSPLKPAALTFLGIAEMLIGKDDDADQRWEDAMDLGMQMAAPAAAAAAAERSALAVRRGDWEAADELARASRAINESFGIEEYATAALLAATTARIAAHKGDATSAKREIARANRLRPQLTRAMPYLAVQARLELAAAQLAMGETAAARLLGREISDVLRRRPKLGVLNDDVEALAARSRLAASNESTIPSLTTAELRLLPLLPTHLSFRAIGEELHISANTVKTQAISIYRKLGVVSRGEAVARATEAGLLQP